MKRHITRYVLAIALALCMFLTACVPAVQPSVQPSVQPEASAAPSDAAPPEVQAPQQSGWLNSTVAGNVTADTPVQQQDDFFLAVNHDWLANAEIAQGEVDTSSFAEREQEVQVELQAILNDDTLDSHEAKLVQRLYQDVMDMDTRNRLGVEPLMPYIDEIRNIRSIEELSEYLEREDNNTLSFVFVQQDMMDSNRYAVNILPTMLSLGDADEYRQMTEQGERKKAALDTLYVKSLMRLGFTEAEAKAAWEACFDFETELAQQTRGASAVYQPDYMQQIYNPVTIAELREMSPNFPVADILEATGYAKSELISLIDPDWLKQLNELYTEENLEGIKARLMLTYVQGYMPFLDQEFLDLDSEYSAATLGAVGSEPLEIMAFKKVDELLGAALGKLYVEEYFSDETKADVEQFIADSMDVYRKRLQNNDWLGDATKQKALDKLDTMGVYVGYPSQWKDYSTLQLKSPEEGGNLIEDLKSISDFLTQESLQKINTTVDKKSGEAIQKTYDVNAYYRANNNSINIPAGILGGVFYDKNGTEAARMGGIGTTIAHEITHAFDSNGSQFDRDGNIGNWWTEEDAAAFQARTGKVATHFSSIESLSGKYVNGDLVVTEATADLGGMSTMLEIAKGIEDFDYDDFFTTYAKIWRRKGTAEAVESALKTDPHPPNYLRANVTVQQFQEFYDAYNIQETDGMYLAPESRLAVW